jgi:hypothetical protein
MTIVLGYGAHASYEEGMCLMEAVSYVAGEDFTDRPECVSPVLAEFGRTLNDGLPYDARQRLTSLIPKLIGTVNPKQDQRDGLRCAHWIMTHWLPAFFDPVRSMREYSTTLRKLPSPTSWKDVEAWSPLSEVLWNCATLAGTPTSQQIVDSSRVSDLAVAKRPVRIAVMQTEATVESWKSVWTAANVSGLVEMMQGSENRTDIYQLQQDTIDLFTELVEGRQ